MSEIKYRGPVVLVVMDGVGLSDRTEYNAVKQAHLETLNSLLAHEPWLALGASGHYVGIADDEMGNSEVGHNALGAGQIILQRSAAAADAVDSGKIFQTEAWREAISRAHDHHTLHFMGIFSDGNVHSDIGHLEKMLKQAHEAGVKKARVHALFDGRDVPPTSEPKYIERFLNFVHALGDPDYKIASGGGRMLITADRYENDWGMVEKGWHASVLGDARQFQDAKEAIATLRAEDPGVQDQYLPPFVVAENGEAIGKIEDGDAVIYFDFRADRAIEMSMAFTYNDFPYFDRIRRPDVYFVGMTEYNEDLHVPAHTLVPTPSFENCLSPYLAGQGIKQYAISEAVKFGHITYYFNGNSHDLPEGEVDEEVPSYLEPFNTRPWMKCAEITDKLVAAINSQEYQFLRINFPGGDMVGHFAELEPTICALEAVDISLKRIIEAVDQLGGITIVTADHGNAEELADADGNPKTAHTTNKVPCIFVDHSENAGRYTIKSGDFGLANLASTISLLLGKSPHQAWLPPLIEVK